MSSNPDISKIVSLIMENPQLIEQISNLAKSEQTNAQEESGEAIVPTNTVIEPSGEGNRKSNTRSQLLRAMKPYLSEGRGRAIESMLTISGILDTMKRG